MLQQSASSSWRCFSACAAPKALVWRVELERPLTGLCGTLEKLTKHPPCKGSFRLCRCPTWGKGLKEQIREGQSKTRLPTLMLGVALDWHDRKHKIRKGFKPGSKYQNIMLLRNKREICLDKCPLLLSVCPACRVNISRASIVNKGKSRREGQGQCT